MYNTNLICTYNYYDDSLYPLSSQEIPEEYLKGLKKPEDDISGIVYRNELLTVFGLREYDNDVVNSEMNIIYEKLKKHEELNSIFNKLAGLFLSEDPDIGFMILFSYHYFFLAHPCICDYLEYEDIRPEYINKLKNVIDNPHIKIPEKPIPK